MTSTQSQPNPNHDMKITRWFEKSQIVAIGIDNYNPPIEPLNTAANDAKKIVEIFRNNHGFEEIHLLLNEQATRPEINNLLTDLKTTVEENDRLVFYYAGHGIALPSESDPEGYLIPQSAVYGNDETYLSMTDLINELRKVNCRHGLIILDCCYAGAIGWSLATRQLGRAKKMYPTTLDTYIDSKAWQILTSSDEDQKANDVMLKNNRDIKEEGEHSPFAHFLIEGLQGKADLFPQGGDGIITADQLHLYLRSVDIKTAQGGQKKRQTPQLLPFPKKHEKGDFVFLLKDYKRIKEDLKKHSPDPKINDENNPYRGLKSYEKTNADVFFGRTRAIEQLCDQVCSSPLTVVLGVSGSGKSSLVKAGLIPHLMQTLEELKQSQLLIPNKETQKHYEKPQHQEVIKEEDVQVICPGKSPAAELEKALNKLHLEAIPSGAKCLLVIDQFEEVETQCRDETEQKKFWQKLVSLLSEQQYRDKLHIIFTLRSDFESRLRNKFEKFEAELNKQTQKPETQKLNWGAARFIVQQMEPQELQEVIEGPAAVKGVYFTAEQRKGRTLVQQLVQEVAGMPGALPLLSFALQEIYRKLAERFVKADRQGNDPPKREIIWDDYDKLNGGVPQSITRRATEEYERLAKDNDGKKLDKAEAQARQTILKWVMLRMVVTSGEGLTRRRVLRSELEYPEPNNKYVNPVIDRFVEARLIVRGGETESEKYVEPSHDALIREWEMIKNWIDEIEKIGKSEKSETILSLQQRLRMNAAANDWDKNDRDTGFLWHNDPRLPQLKQVFNSPDSWLNQLETDFVKNSIEEKRKQEDELTQNRINELTPSANARFKDHEQLEALTHILKAGKLVQKLICEKSPYLSEETRRNTPLVLRQILSKVEEKNRFRLQSASAHTVDFSRDGQIVATVDWNSIVTLFDPEGKQINPGQMNGDMLTELSQTPEGKPLFSLGSRSGRLYKKDNGKLVLSDYYLSPDGRIIAHLNRNVKKGKVTLYSRDGAKLNTLTGLDEDTLMTVAFSPDGQIIAAGGWYGWLYLWQRDGTSIKKQSIGGGSINAIDFSPKVEMLATGSNDGKVRLWQPDGTESKLFQAHSDAIWGLCFSPKVEMFATASNDRTVKLWKSDGTEVKTLEGHKGIVRAVAFNPNNDSQNLASVSDDGSVKIWNLGGTGLKMLDRQENSVYTVRFSPDGQTILTTSGHGKVSFWTTDGILLKQYPHWHNGPISTLDFSPNGERIVTASGDKEVRLHNSDGNGRKEIKSYKDQIEVLGVSFSPDNQVIALADQQGSVKLYNLDDGTLTTLRDASGSPAWAVKFSPDGNILASAHSEGVVELRQLNGTLLNTLASGTYSGYPNLVLGIDFSPNGDLIASAHLDGTVRLWQLDGSSDQPLILGEPGSNVVKERIFIPVRFSPDGQTIASAHADGTVKLWKLDGSLYKLYKILEGHKSCVTAVDFSPNGKTLAFASEDRTVILWDLDGIMDLDGLLQCGCQWAEGYLTNNLNVTNEDRQIILNINENP